MTELLMYPNRKLYNPRTASYTNLSYISELMSLAEPFRVSCRVTGVDLTQLAVAKAQAKSIVDTAKRQLGYKIKEKKV